MFLVLFLTILLTFLMSYFNCSGGLIIKPIMLSFLWT